MDKRKYGMRQSEDLIRALEFKGGNLALNECFSQHGVPKRSLKRHEEATVHGDVCSRSKKSMSTEVFT
jgi:hypothetical protein